MNGLGGVGVLVTRPRHQAGDLCRALEAAGARVVLLPSLVIESLDSAELRRRAATLVPVADWLAFTSPNAVTAGLALLAAAGVTPPFPPRCAAVGPGTARELTARKVPVACYPDSGGGAADLLREAAFTVTAGDRAVIVHGEGGRAVLPQGLRARGARVDSLVVYRRCPAPLDTAQALEGWRSGWLRVAIVTSRAGLESLVAGVGVEARCHLLTMRLVVVSARIAEAAVAMGFRHPPVVARDPGEASLLAAVQRAIDTDTERKE